MGKEIKEKKWRRMLAIVGKNEEKND